MYITCKIAKNKFCSEKPKISKTTHCHETIVQMSFHFPVILTSLNYLNKFIFAVTVAVWLARQTIGYILKCTT